MERYNVLMPDAMERFFSLAEKQSTHRQNMEKIIVEGQNKRAFIGVYAAWFTTIMLILAGGWLIYSDKNVAGYTSFILAVIPRLASLLFKFSSRERKKPANKDGLE